ncbi:carbohydrate ABC transporter permease [Rhizobium sp. P007]|uniref:carbohydrate ABC transporter permease n=1 Tax=Rhizobium sp. P007 TaxID=285908 RepID=UPI000EE36BF5|nr:carbohydrate ABC transporter permease [Rhizobium sp. P007]KAB2694129.1 carbohydrate ABC transporter permease [Ochrobactrum sp. Kaboul]CAD7038339.1 carbohydrate ABC transporter permease [Rhizobium sp. P007]HCJ73619.1 carbohydrate ABC transporter permease [Agrobacterium sp.]
MRHGLSWSLAGLFRHAMLLAIAAFALMPFAVMLTTSIKPAAEIFTEGYRWWPHQTAFIANYTEALTRVPVARYLLNGAVVTVSVLFLQMLVAMPAAYALAKLRFIGRKAAFGLVLFCLLIPYHAIAVPLFMLLHMTGLLGGYAALVLPFTISAFGIFLMRQFFVSVPDDLLDAARMDGLGEFSIVWRVMLPASLPALSAFAIFSVIAHWNDYFWPLIAVSDDRYFTPPLGIVAFRNAEAGNDYGPLMAATTIIVLPLVVFFLIAQRRFIEGIGFTGVK